MYIVSNKDMEDIIRYVEAYRLSVDVKTCDIKTYNQVRMAGLMLRRLRAKQPLEKQSSENVRKTVIRRPK